MKKRGGVKYFCGSCHSEERGICSYFRHSEYSEESSALSFRLEHRGMEKSCPITREIQSNSVFLHANFPLTFVTKSNKSFEGKPNSFLTRFAHLNILLSSSLKQCLPPEPPFHSFLLLEILNIFIQTIPR